MAKVQNAFETREAEIMELARRFWAHLSKLSSSKDLSNYDKAFGNVHKDEVSTFLTHFLIEDIYLGKEERIVLFVSWFTA